MRRPPSPCASDFKVLHDIETAKTHADHYPVVCGFQWNVQVDAPQNKSPRRDERKMEDPGLRRRFTHALENAELTSWEVGLDEHTHQVTETLAKNASTFSTGQCQAAQAFYVAAPLCNGESTQSHPWIGLCVAPPCARSTDSQSLRHGTED